MGEDSKVSVKIQGRDYVVVNCTDKEHVEKVAYYVDKKIAQIVAANPSLDTVKATTLVCMNLADSLFKAIDMLSEEKDVKITDVTHKEIAKLEKEGIPMSDVENNN